MKKIIVKYCFCLLLCVNTHTNLYADAVSFALIKKNSIQCKKITRTVLKTVALLKKRERLYKAFMRRFLKLHTVVLHKITI